MASKPRISLKLSAKHPDHDAGSQPATSRKRAKRLVLSDDDGGAQGAADAATPSSPSGSATRRSHTLALGDSDSELTEPEPEPEPEPELSSPLSQPSPTHRKRSKGRKPSEGPPAKRKRTHQDASSDEEYNTAAPSGDEDGLIIHTKRQPRLTAKAKANRGKSRSFTVGARDERKAGRTRRSNSTETSQKKTKRVREAEDDAVDVVNVSVNDTETKADTRSPSPPKEPAAPPAKRPKYPTIKKNKAPGATADPAPAPAPAPSLKTSSNTAAKPAATKPPELPKTTLAGTRVPPMMVGNADFDLRDESVYKALFNQSGGSTPRSGLARQKKDEERRKELNKMRDEARAKKLSDMSPSFNLQAQYEKIKRFEETLGRRCLFPNVLAAKWREIYEGERRKVFMEQTRSPSGDGHEEGQVSAHTDLGR